MTRSREPGLSVTRAVALEERKVRNRAAAKRSRDRKKALMISLEEDVALLRLENQRLRMEIEHMKSTVACWTEHMLLSDPSVENTSEDCSMSDA